MIYKDDDGGVLDIEVWDGCDVTGDVLGAPRSDANLGLLVDRASDYVYGRHGYDIPQAEARVEWRLSRPGGDTEFGRARGSDLYEYCDGCGALIDEGNAGESDWRMCAWCAGE